MARINRVWPIKPMLWETKLEIWRLEKSRNTTKLDKIGLRETQYTMSCWGCLNLEENWQILPNESSLVVVELFHLFAVELNFDWTRFLVFPLYFALTRRGNLWQRCGKEHENLICICLYMYNVRSIYDKSFIYLIKNCDGNWKPTHPKTRTRTHTQTRFSARLYTNIVYILSIRYHSKLQKKSHFFHICGANCIFHRTKDSCLRANNFKFAFRRITLFGWDVYTI